jgi:hypothetical protein
LPTVAVCNLRGALDKNNGCVLEDDTVIIDINSEFYLYRQKNLPERDYPRK